MNQNKSYLARLGGIALIVPNPNVEDTEFSATKPTTHFTTIDSSDPKFLSLAEQVQEEVEIAGATGATGAFSAQANLFTSVFGQ